MEINVRLMVKSDLEQVLKIRNDPDTYNFLHTPKAFSLEDANSWFDKDSPIWYVIEAHIIVGYMRTSNWNYVDRSLWIGCDIDKDFRRQGIAFTAYNRFLDMLRKAGWNTAKLSVLKTNTKAFNLYKKLGFDTYEETTDSFNMSLKLNSHINTGKGAKVIACYFGNRRFDPRNENPQNAAHAYTMLEFIWKLEQTIDQGYPHDTVFVHNELLPTDPVTSMADVEKCKEFLNRIDGQQTKNGKVIVIHRPNIGISFGAFDHAHNMLKNDYDFWFFTEDDQVIIKENTFNHALKMLHMPKEVPNGFVATVGVNREWGMAANGGCGVTSREILQKVTENNFSDYLQRGSLPFMYIPTLQHGAVQTNNNHEWAGEVMFTRIIYTLGYYLEEHDWTDINLSWKDTRFEGRRTSRCHPYRDWMEDITLTKEQVVEKLLVNK